MKLSELKVGMRVDRADWDFHYPTTVVAIMHSGVCLDNGRELFIEKVENGWIIVEPLKKPSEIVAKFTAGRIYEIASLPIGRGFRDLSQYANDRIDAILQYLDEQAEQK